MAREHGPYSVAFPVDFTSKGDTTRDAFRKHMDEITRIYGILTGLDADTMDTDAISGVANGLLQTHINSTNPHPNYKPSWTDLVNKPGLNDLTGTLSATKIIGLLNQATIPQGSIVGLEEYVNSKISNIPASKGDGITESSLNENGYVKFSNGLLIQWGVGKLTGNDGVETFGREFPSACLIVVGSAYYPSEDIYHHDLEYDSFTIFGWNKQRFWYTAYTGTFTKCTYIAIGY